MDWKLRNVTLLLTGIFLMGLSFTTVAQEQEYDLNDAKRTIKKGDLAKRSDNYVEAIEAFGKTVEICSQLFEEEAVTIQEDAEKKLVKAHLDYANELLKQDKFDKSLENYNKAIELAKKYEQEDYKEKAERNIPKVYYAKGKSFISDEIYEEAIKNFDLAIEKDPEYGWAYIRKAQAYMSLDNPEEMVKAVDKAMEIGEKQDEEKVVSTAKNIAYKHFASKGINALKAKDYQSAAENLQEAVNYNGSPKIKHYLAMSYGQISDYENAIKYEEMAIEELKEEESEEAMAQYYYSLGSYYEQNGNKTEACSAYKNAAHGDYKKNAEYKIKHVLKCQ